MTIFFVSRENVGIIKGVRVERYKTVKVEGGCGVFDDRRVKQRLDFSTKCRMIDYTENKQKALHRSYRY